MLKMFDIKNVHTAVTAEKAELHTFGYFANEVASLRQTIQNKKPSFKTVYSRLEGVLEDKFERRFYCSSGTFSLFYPMDKTENILRY